MKKTLGYQYLLSIPIEMLGLTVKKIPKRFLASVPRVKGIKSLKRNKKLK